jgi:hypothetical protein
MAKIEGKTFVMAIRYNVAGHEYWDNNHCQDYVVTFTKARVTRDNKSDDEDATDVESLKSRLEQVISQGKDKPNNPVCSPKPSTTQSRKTEPPSLKSGVFLGPRYDFDTSLKKSNVWRPTDIPAWDSPPKNTCSLSPPKRRSRTVSAHTLPSFTPWSEKISQPDRSAISPLFIPSFERQPPLASPRDFEEERLFITSPTNPDDIVNATLSPGRTRGRNHQRGYIDEGPLGTNSGVRRTPPGTPTSKSFELDPLSLSPIPPMSLASIPFPRRHSPPPFSTSDSSASSGSFGLDLPEKPTDTCQLLASQAASQDIHRDRLGLGESSGDSEQSSLSTPTSSRSPTPSPKDAFRRPALPPLRDDVFNYNGRFGAMHPMQPVSPGTRYRHFLDK